MAEDTSQVLERLGKTNFASLGLATWRKRSAQIKSVKWEYHKKHHR